MISSMQPDVCVTDNGAARDRHCVRPAVCAQHEGRGAIPCVPINRRARMGGLRVPHDQLPSWPNWSLVLVDSRLCRS
jgi:hypothetical protein